jgi:hypothetical protein
VVARSSGLRCAVESALDGPHLEGPRIGDGASEAMQQVERRGTPSAIYEYGDLRVGEHFDRLAAENNRRDTAASVRGHHD